MPNCEKEKGIGYVSFLETSDNNPIVGEISENKVNVETRQVKLSDILGESAWGEQELAQRMFCHYRHRIRRRLIA